MTVLDDDLLRDRVVVVSGGTQGVGAAVARAATRNGATVVVTGSVIDWDQAVRAPTTERRTRQ